MSLGEISISGTDPVWQPRLFAWPVLVEGSFSYPYQESKYTISVSKVSINECSFVLSHKIIEAPLISNLLKDKKAMYACAVSSPNSCYRKLFVSESTDQKIEMEIDKMGEPPFYTPMVVVTEKLTTKLNAKKHMLDISWDKLQITLEVGSRLAINRMFDFRSSVGDLLEIIKDEDLKSGQFRADISLDDKRRPLIGYVAKDLFSFLRYQEKTGNCQNIHVHILTACLYKLHKEINNGDIEENLRSRNIGALNRILIENSCKPLDHGDFCPELAATTIEPLEIPTFVTEDEDD